jgi:hypothetical protein
VNREPLQADPTRAEHAERTFGSTVRYSATSARVTGRISVGTTDAYPDKGLIGNANRVRGAEVANQPRRRLSPNVRAARCKRQARASSTVCAIAYLAHAVIWLSLWT